MNWVASLMWLMVVLSGSDHVVNSPGQFVGRVRCLDPLVCTAEVTQVSGQSFTGGSYLELRGAYVPANITSGFKLAEAYFSPNCSTTPTGCGGDHDTFITSLNTLAAAYHQTNLVPGHPKITYANATYRIDQKPMRWKGSEFTLNMCNGPIFQCNTNWAGSLVTIPGTITINVATNDHHAIITGGTLCGMGTCYDGDEILNTGDRVRLVGTGNWTGANPAQVVTTLGMDPDGTGFYFAPSLTANYAGTAEIGTAKLLVFDGRTNIAPTQYPRLYGANEMLCGRSARVISDGFCLPVNAAAGRTIAGGYREVPIQEVVQYHTYEMVNTLSIASTCGRNDSSLTIADTNTVPGGSSSGGAFEGYQSGCFGLDEAMQQLHGDDPNSPATRGAGALVTILSPGFKYKAVGTGFGVGRAFLLAGNSSIVDIDASTLEGVMQLAWIPQGGQNIGFHGLSQENAMGGYGDCTTVESQENRPPFFDVGEWKANPTDIAAYSLSGERMFMGCRTAPFVRINSPTRSARLKLNIAIQNTSKLLDITGSKVSVVGDVECDLGTFAKPGSCGRPTQGHTIGLTVTNLDGTLNWQGDGSP